VFAAEGTGQNARIVLDIISIICRQIPGLNSCHGAGGEGRHTGVVLSSSKSGKKFDLHFLLRHLLGSIDLKKLLHNHCLDSLDEVL
jgi:hypothetical protein